MSACPYCLTPVGEGQESVACDSCGTAHHTECWSENGGCCVRDCAKAVRNIELDLPPAHGDRLVLSREAVETAPQRRAEPVSNPCMRCGKQVAAGELYCAGCRPERDEGQDARNAGPLLIMVALLALVVGWIVYVSTTPAQEKTDEARPGVSTKMTR